MKKLMVMAVIALIAGQSNLNAMKSGQVLVDPKSNVHLEKGLYDAEAPTGLYATQTGKVIARIGGQGSLGGDLVLEPSMPGKPARINQNPHVKTEKGIDIPTTGNYIIDVKKAGVPYMSAGLIKVASVGNQDIVLELHLVQ